MLFSFGFIGELGKVSDQRVVAILNEDGILLIDPSAVAKVSVGMVCCFHLQTFFFFLPRALLELNQWLVSGFLGAICCQ